MMGGIGGGEGGGGGDGIILRFKMMMVHANVCNTHQVNGGMAACSWMDIMMMF